MNIIPRYTSSWGEALGVIMLAVALLIICATFAGAALFMLWLVWPPIPVALVCYIFDSWLYERKNK